MTAATPAQPAPVSPHLECAVCASGVTVPHGAGGTVGQAACENAPEFRNEECPIHPGKQHVQVRNGSDWLCLRGLADLQERGGPYLGPDLAEALRDERNEAWTQAEQLREQVGITRAAAANSIRQLREENEQLRAQLAAQEPHAAPGPAGCECGHAQTGHAFSDDVCAVPDCPCPGYRRTPQPELAAAMRETGEVRDGYARLCEEFGDSPQSGQSARISLTVLNRHRKAAGLPVRRPAPAGERRDAFMQMRERLDAMAGLTTEMHAEADKTAPPGSEPDPEDTARAQVLHEYAARIRQLLEGK